MKNLDRYTKYIPYFYFISVIIFWFTHLNRATGIWAYPILILGIPFIFQLLKPSTYVNFLLGIMFICISSYLLAIFIGTRMHFFNFPEFGNALLLYGFLLIPANFIMAFWIIRNSLRGSF